MQARSSSQHRQEGSEGPGRHAVVVGGSIGGMLAARVLSDHFDRITLIERDQLPEGTANRPGVPQARHLHFFLKRGLMAVEELFPGVKPDLLAAGSHLLDQGKDFRILYRSGWSPKVACDLEICAFTRPLLESTIRRHLLEDSKISIVEGCEVSALVLDESGDRVSGVASAGPRGGEDGGEEMTLKADFVVDVSGRGSKAPEWLQALGYEAPEEEVVDAFWGYATRIYEPVDGLLGGLEEPVRAQPPAVPAAGRHHPAHRGEPLDRDGRRSDARLSADRRGGFPASSPRASRRRSSTGRSRWRGRCRRSGATARRRTGCATTRSCRACRRAS